MIYDKINSRKILVITDIHSKEEEIFRMIFLLNNVSMRSQYLSKTFELKEIHNFGIFPLNYQNYEILITLPLNYKIVTSMTFSFLLISDP